MIQSIRNQSSTNWECIIIDDGSDYECFDNIHKLIEGDARFSLHSRNSTYPKGISGARNFGISLANGNHIMFCDDDDILHPNSLFILNSIIDNYTIDFIHFRLKSFKNTCIFHEEKNAVLNYFTDHTFVESTFVFKEPFVSCSVLWKKELLNFNNFNSDLKYAEEWELFNKLLFNGAMGLCINNILYFNRIHSSSNTAKYFTGSRININSKIKAISLLFPYLNKYKGNKREMYLYVFKKALELNSSELFCKVLYYNFNEIKWFLYLKVFAYHFYKKIK